MNEVQVYFVGMVMWFLAAPGPWALMPELSNDPNAHFAAIEAAPSAFVGGACPGGFTVNDRGNCVYALNGKGATGGVRIALLTDKPAGGFPTNAFCALPPLQRTTLYALKPEFTPPLGPANAAWMAAVGGTPLSGEFPCASEPAGNCPRFVRWTVPSTTTGNVVLSLDNLRTGTPLFARLTNGAQVVISNSPPDDVEAHAQHAKTRAKTPATAGTASPTPLEAEDWCFYFRMVTIPGGPDPQCPGPPRIPPPCPELAPPPFLHPEKVLFQTVACSNSQYP
jgi:hypothetical protein